MLMLVVTLLTPTALTMSAQARRQQKPPVGFPVGPKVNKTVPKRFIVDPQEKGRTCEPGDYNLRLLR